MIKQSYVSKQLCSGNSYVYLGLSTENAKQLNK